MAEEINHYVVQIKILVIILIAFMMPFRMFQVYVTQPINVLFQLIIKILASHVLELLNTLALIIFVKQLFHQQHQQPVLQQQIVPLPLHHQPAPH
jgi:hypothetical protein